MLISSQVQTKRSRILTLRGKRQVGCISSAERGILSTAAVCMSATGHFIPLMLIFPHVRMTEQLKNGAPPGTIFSCNPSGWMTSRDFSKWFDHFLDHTRPTAEKPILLLLDGHSSHVKNLAFLEKASASHVTILSFPPHCTHRLQPLDVCYMGSLKTHLSKTVESHLKINPGIPITINEISSLLGKAFLSASTPSIAINGFQKAGIVPFDRSIFTDADFAPSRVSDVPLTANDNDRAEDEPDFNGFEVEELEESRNEFRRKFANFDPAGNQISRMGQRDGASVECHHQTMAEPNDVCISSSETSSNVNRQPLAADDGNWRENPLFEITPSQIKPLPKMINRKSCPKRKKEKATVVTSHSYRNTLKKKNKQKGNRRTEQIKTKTV